MNELTQQEVDSMHWLDEQGIGFLPQDESYKVYERDYGRNEGNALIGVVNVAKFYLCCYLIVKAVQFGVRFIR